MRRLKSFLVLSSVTVVASFAISVVLDVAFRQGRGVAAEDLIALPVLFKVRGPLPSPPQVVIVSMDTASTAVLNLPVTTRDWPRSLHARLIRGLVKQGAAAIAIDLDFARQTDPAEDEALAQAIEEAGNVILVERVDRLASPGVVGDQWRRPIPALAESAGALAPAPVPAVALVAQTWSFVPGPDRSEVPTLPAATLHVYARRLLEEFPDAMGRVERSVAGPALRTWEEVRRTMHLVRSELKDSDASSVRALDAVDARRKVNLLPDDARTLTALVRLYREPEMFYLHYYGPPGTIRTIPYHQALDQAATSDDFSGKAVFIGAGSSAIWSVDQPDTYRASYPIRDGQQFSGVEIHATAFANLLRGELLRPVGPVASLACFVGFAMAATAIAYFLPRRRTAVAVLLLAAAYYAAAQLLFNSGRVLVPLAVPLLVQVPVAFVAIHFARKPILKQVVNGACLVADIADSTARARALGLDRWRKLLDEYWPEVGGAARRWSATLQAPQVADCVVCFWTTPGSAALPVRGGSGPKQSGGNVDPVTRHRGCMAALEISRAVARFNAAHPDERLPTRMGLYVGQFCIRRDLDGERCTVDGFTVSAATRFEQQGKALLCDTHARSPILASADVVEGLDDLLIRYVGRHELKGVGVIPVYEVLGERRRAEQAQLDLCDRFTMALRLYEEERWREAQLAFREALELSATDGPSRYFERECVVKLAAADSIGGAAHVV